MPKPINTTIGTVPCLIRGCSEVAEVRREKNHERGALYVVCPEHGRVSVNGASYKEKIAVIIEAGLNQPPPEPEPEKKPEPVPEKVTEKSPVVKEKEKKQQAEKRSFLAEALTELGGWMND